MVSISTSGAAPILGQAIRRRIEALLPQSLSRWAKLATSIRMAVNQNLLTGAQRRRFWQGFSHRAFTSAPDRRSAMQLLNSIQKITSQKNIYKLGKITSLEIDPLDAELLTLKTIRILQSADVILYDQEISPTILEFARREAKHIAVGSSKSGNICGLEQTEPTMKSLAKSGKNIVRLTATRLYQSAPRPGQVRPGH